MESLVSSPKAPLGVHSVPNHFCALYFINFIAPLAVHSVPNHFCALYFINNIHTPVGSA
jgi:hypothetical protein